METRERKKLVEFCKHCVIAQQLMDNETVLSQIHFQQNDYVPVIFIEKGTRIFRRNVDERDTTD